MERPFDKHFRDKLSDYEAAPSDLSWAGISAELEVQRIRQKRRRLLAYSLIGLLLIATGGGYFGWNYLGAPADDHREMAQAEAFHIQLPAFQQGEAASAAFVDQVEDNAHEPTASPLSSIEPVSGGVTSRTMSLTQKPITYHKPFLEYLSSASFDSPSWENVEFSSIEPFQKEDGSINEDAFKGFKIGLMGGVQNGAVAGEDIDAFMGDRAISRSIKLRPLLGLVAQYDFSSKIGMEANLIISSGEGQLFKSGDLKQDLSLNYIRIPMMLSYKFTNLDKSGQHPRSYRLMAGLQYGRLNWVNVDDFDNSLEPGAFNRSEVGFTAGVAYDQYLAEDYMLTVGARGSVNNHIHSFPNFLDEENVVNYTMGLYLQINYSIK